MKKKILYIALTLTSFSFTATSCSKSDDGNTDTVTETYKVDDKVYNVQVRSTIPSDDNTLYGIQVRDASAGSHFLITLGSKPTASTTYTVVPVSVEDAPSSGTQAIFTIKSNEFGTIHSETSGTINVTVNGSKATVKLDNVQAQKYSTQGTTDPTGELHNISGNFTVTLN